MNQKLKILSLSLVGVVLVSALVFVSNIKSSGESEIKNFHAAMYYFDNQDFFPESVKVFKNVKPLSPAPRVFIVNQHILAAHLIAQQFALAADPKVKTVVLITQNNWNVGNSSIITSQYGWQTALGDILPATHIVQDLINKKLATAEEDIFTREHGITGIVPYIAHSFPNAKIVPLVIRDKTADQTVDALAEELSKLDLSHTAIIASIDMSHYLPKYIADAHDRLTVQSIKTFDYDMLPKLDIDTAPTLRAIMKVAESHKEQTFIQTGGVNSAEIVNDPDLLQTTSYVTGYFASGQADSERTIHMLFVGDIMLDRAIAKHADVSGVDSIFAKLERLFLGTHMVIGNHEGSMSNQPSVSKSDYSLLRFTFEPKFADMLKKFNFSALSLANNHALDFGGDGYNQTVQHLKGAKLVPFGSPRNDVNLSAKIPVEGKNVCVVGYHDLYVHDSTSALEEIQRIRSECSYIVLFAHWGAEYVPEPIPRQKELAHEFIDAGADLVIGAHPHVVEPIEIYKNKAIFYSLGNFIFDQRVSFATEHGLAVNVEWGKDKTIFTLVPTTIENYEVGIAEAPVGQKILNALVNKDLLSPDVSSAILKHNQFIIWNQK